MLKYIKKKKIAIIYRIWEKIGLVINALMSKRFNKIQEEKSEIGKSEEKVRTLIRRKKMGKNITKNQAS